MNPYRLMRLAASMLGLATAFVAPPSDAKLVRLDITAREVVANGMAFGDTGAYEKLTGTAYFEVDPRDPLNAQVFDIDKAPKNAAIKSSSRPMP